MGRGGEAELDIERIAPEAILDEVEEMDSFEPSYVRAMWTSGGKLRTSVVPGPDRSIIMGYFDIVGGAHNGKMCHLSVSTADQRLYPQLCRAVRGSYDASMCSTEQAEQIAQELGGGMFTVRVARRLDADGEPYHLIVGFLER